MFITYHRLSFLSLFLLLTFSVICQDLTLSPGSILFAQPVYTTKSDSTNITLTNSKCGNLTVYYITSPNASFKAFDSSAFTLGPLATKVIKVKFSPYQNIEYNSAIILHTSSGDFSIPVKGYGRFIESYYDSTYNKFDENLKNTLNTILANNYQSFSYNAARDKMFMEFDNKKINGQGASQNTLECIYTGRLAIGYTSRSDCQTNDNFNTEHTWPQSLFSSNLPMVSDLNHLFPTDDAANSTRGNYPFGMVANPTWTVGGSKGIAGLFEPRDAQKGRTARAMLYFAIRYNSPTYGLVSFFGPQEAILRTWCLQFMPDSIDRKRNNDIFGYQKNRNPFIDHPEFLERITSIANTSVAPTKLLLWCDTQNVAKNYSVYDTMDYKVVIHNYGNSTITCSKILSTQSLLTLSFPTTTIAPQTSLQIVVKQRLSNINTIMDTLFIENNSSNLSVIRIPFKINITTLHITSTKTNILSSNDSAILNINTTGNVSWNTGALGNSLTVKNAGNFYATVTDSNGCHFTDTVNITKSGVGINNASVSTFKYFPNPASQVLYVDNNNTALTFTLINTLGEVISNKEAGANERITFDLSTVKDGIYFIKNSNGVGNKIIISK